MREREGCMRKREREWGGMRERDKLSVFVFLKLVNIAQAIHNYIIIYYEK